MTLLSPLNAVIDLMKSNRFTQKKNHSFRAMWTTYYILSITSYLFKIICTFMCVYMYICMWIDTHTQYSDFQVSPSLE